MAVNKVTLINQDTKEEEILIDLSEDNVTVAQVAKGAFFHLPNGERVEGASTAEEIILNPLTATANGTYSPEAGQGYSTVTVAIPTWDGSTKILGTAIVTITNSSDSLVSMSVLDNNMKELDVIAIGATQSFTVDKATVIHIEPGDTIDGEDLRWETVSRDDAIIINGSGASISLTIDDDGAIELKLYDAGADA